MKILLFLLTFLAITQTLSVSSLSENELQQEMSSGKHFWLIYRTNNHQHKDTLEQVNDVLSGFFKVASVESSEESLVLYGDDRQNSISYSGQFSAKEIVSFVLEHFDSFIQSRAKEAKSLKAYQEFQKQQAERANKEWSEEQERRKKSDTLLLQVANWDSAFLKSREPFIINFYEANSSACIDLNKQWELLSTELKGKVRVAKINITEASNYQLEEDLKITKYPTIRFYKNGPKKTSQYTEYEGVRKKFTILEWVNEKLNQKVQKTEILFLNKDNFQTLCKTTKNTCVITFLDGSEPEGTISKLQKLSLQHIKKPITFLISQKGEQSAFESQAGVESFPDTVMIYCKLKKIWRMGGLNIEEIDNTINEISLGNRNNFVRYNFVEDIL